MESESSWTRLSNVSRLNHSRSDAFHLDEEIDGDNDSRQELLCPFCAEDFDIVGLFCHIDEEHSVEATNGICPVCAKKVGLDLISHLTMQHGSLLKVQRKRRYHRAGSDSALSILKKELREGNLHSFLGLGGDSISSFNTEPDPLLSSFMYNPPVLDQQTEVEAHSLAVACLEGERSMKDSPEREIESSPLTNKDQEEKDRKSEFVRGLLFSTFVGSDLW